MRDIIEGIIEEACLRMDKSSKYEKKEHTEEAKKVCADTYRYIVHNTIGDKVLDHNLEDEILKNTEVVDFILYMYSM